VRYGILADVHANLPALEAALNALAPRSIDRYIVAGDLVGYGPNPNECVEAVAALEPVCVVGNHDLMALGRLSDARCIQLGRDALRWTRSVLGSDAKAYLEALPLRAEAPGGVVVAHGTIDDPQEYTTNAREALVQLGHLERDRPAARVLVLGHTHRPLVVGSKTRREEQRTGRIDLDPDARYVVNVGGVGQARELRARARFGVLDLDAGALELHATRYDIASCRRALRKVGLSPRSCHLRPTPAGAARRALRVVRRAHRPSGRDPLPEK
jgi:predicted phosphodiesterase